MKGYQTLDNTKEHQKLVDDILFSIGSNPRIRIWTRQVGFDYMRKIKFGVEGEADLQGIIAPTGRMLSIECKTGKGKLNAAQKRWRAMVLKFGGLYIEARSLQQVIDEVEKAL